MPTSDDKDPAATSAVNPDEVMLLRQIHDVLLELLLRASRDEDQLHDAALLQAWHGLERKTGRKVTPLPIPLPIPLPEPARRTSVPTTEDGDEG